MRFGVVTFPGSNCDDDAVHAVTQVLKQPCARIWHKETTLPALDVVIIPGGFSYGDHLRCGAIARFSPVMNEVVKFAEKGGYVLGICNGFQILTEAGLLPGALLRNRGLKFACGPVVLKAVNRESVFTRFYEEDQAVTVPIAHGEGRYFADEATIARLEGEGRVAFRYVDEFGEATDAANPNGSVNNIAGILNERGNVLGMMPHPERASEKLLGSNDGRVLFESLLGERLPEEVEPEPGERQAKALGVDPLARRNRGPVLAPSFTRPE